MAGWELDTNGGFRQAIEVLRADCGEVGDEAVLMERLEWMCLYCSVHLREIAWLSDH